MSRIRTPSGLALAAAAVLLVACASDQEKFSEHMSRAEAYTAEKKDKEALIEYFSALQIYPENADVNERIAEVFRDNGAAENAAFFYGEAYRLDPDRIDAAMEQVQLLFYNAEQAATWSGGTIETGVDRAEVILRDVLERSPSVPIVHVARAQLELLKKNSDEALTAIMTGVQLAPEDPLIWLQLGAVHKARIQEKLDTLEPWVQPTGLDFLYESALEAYERADELKGGSVRAKLERALVYESWPGHLDEGEQAFRDAVDFAKQERDDDLLIFAADAANQFARRHDRTEMRIWALRELLAVPGSLRIRSVATAEARLEVRRRDPLPSEDDDARMRIWDELAHLHDEREAGGGERVYAELLSQRPEDPIAAAYYANYLNGLGRSDEAIAHLEGAIEAGYATPALWEQLVEIQIKSVGIAEADDTYQRMVEVHPKDALTQRSAARLALARGRPDRAAEILRGIVAQFEDFETLRMQSYAEYLSGNPPAATVAWDRALTMAGGSTVEEARLRARLNHISGVLRAARDGDLDMALLLAQEAARVDPSPDILDTLGWVRLQRGEESAAVEVLETALLLRPDSPSVRYRLALALQRSGNEKRAQEMLEAALAAGIFPEAEYARRLLAQLEREQRRVTLPPLF